jgi:glycosyltransferase involved in cell wall biosynthesis
MRVLIVNRYESNGGAARAAKRLHLALLDSGIDSNFLVGEKSSSDKTVTLSANFFTVRAREFLDSLKIKFYKLFNPKSKSEIPFSLPWLSNRSLVKKINSLNPDIVHLHWINEGLLNFSDLKSIKAPVVWSLHDMWVFTGGCHYSGLCSRYLASCGQCWVLKSCRESDLSKSLLKDKERELSKISNIKFIGLSSWLTGLAQKSSLLKRQTVQNLPNPIDCSLFKPQDKDLSREKLNLPKDKKLILFGAMSSTDDPRKGYAELLSAIDLIKDDDVELVVFGNNEEQNLSKLRFKTHFLGKITNDIDLITLYSSVDVMVVPSLQENLSNVIMEALACSTPTVAFDIGGNRDLISHKKTGYLAKELDKDDLAAGIEWVLNSPNYSEICDSARESVLEKFESGLVAKKYIELYESFILEASKSGDEDE